MGFDAPARGTDRARGAGGRKLLRPVLVAAAVATVVSASVPTHAGSAETSAADVVRTSPLRRELRWTGAATAEARGAALGRLVADELVAAGVPAPVVEVADTGAFLGRFDARQWLLQLSAAALSTVGTRTSGELAELAGTARHEARHAVQWFRIAQLLAARGRSPAAIAAEMSLPIEIAVSAALRPLGPGERTIQAEQWWNSIYGTGSGSRNRVLAELFAAKTAHDDAARVYRASPSEEAAAAIGQASKALEPVYAAYRALPEEADAFRVQGEFVEDLREALARRRGHDEENRRASGPGDDAADGQPGHRRQKGRQ